MAQNPPPSYPSVAPSKPDTQHAELRAGNIALALSIVLLFVKFTAYLFTRSNAIFSDAMETVVNVFSASFALYAINLAHRPADKDHPYGHGKIEFFSGALEGGMILFAAAVIAGKVATAYLFHSGNYLSPQLDIGAALLGAALLLNAITGLYLRRSGRRSGSMTLEASGIHLITDAVDSVIALVAVLLMRLIGWTWIDSAGALMVAAYMAWQGAKLLRRSSAGLMDEQDAADQKLLRQILDSHLGPEGKQPHICSYHKLRHRHSGRYHWVDFHIMVPGNWTIDQGHKVASTIEYEIELALGEGNATAHVEPCVDESCKNCKSVKLRSENPLPAKT